MEEKESHTEDTNTPSPSQAKTPRSSTTTSQQARSPRARKKTTSTSSSKAESSLPSSSSKTSSQDTTSSQESLPTDNTPSSTQQHTASVAEIAEPVSWTTQQASATFAEEYPEVEHKKMEKSYEESLKDIQEKKIVEAIVLRETEKYVIVSIGGKSDGLLHHSEFRELKEQPKVGDTIEVFIEQQENRSGELILSHRKARMLRAWERIERSQTEDQIIEGFVKRRTKGGLIVDLFGIEAFLPGSQVDIKPVKDFDIYVEKNIEVKVVKINYSNDNVVVSHKALIEKDIELQKTEILKTLEKGQVLEGTVRNITNFGAFIDLGGIDGLLHVTDISWKRITHPKDIFSIGDKVNVVVLDYDHEKKRISLGMKQLEKHPWEQLEGVSVGDKIKGKIVNITDYGAFLEIAEGVEGLIHVSEMSWSQHLRSPEEFVSLGEEIEAVIISMDEETHKMALGLKQLREDPWKKQDVTQKYAIGTKHQGKVRNLTSYGLFLELEEGIDGLVHVSDLSWIKKIKHPSEIVKVGEELEVMVLEIDVSNRRLALSHKHLEENPWDDLEATFARGTTHSCTVMEIKDRIAHLELPYGIEGVCYPKNLTKKDGTSLQVGEQEAFLVTEFSKESRRIVLSHAHTFSRPSKGGKKYGKSGTDDAVRGVVAELNQEVEKSTMAELQELSSIKEKIDKQNASSKKTTDKQDASSKKTTDKK